MNIETVIDTDLTVKSFAYVARQLAKSRAAHGLCAYEQILCEAEKHHSALRLAQRDVLERAEQLVRKQTLTKTEFQRLHEITAQAIGQAQQAITHIAAQYAPHKLAA